MLRAGRLPAAMEPGRCGRVELRDPGDATDDGVRPQWSPAVAAGSSSTPDGHWKPAHAGRNGARPLRPGRAQIGRAVAGNQASTGRNGARPLRPGRGPHTRSQLSTRIAAAMEPGRCGRVESTLSHTGPRFAGRNGARPLRPGRA